MQSATTGIQPADITRIQHQVEALIGKATTLGQRVRLGAVISMLGRVNAPVGEIPVDDETLRAMMATGTDGWIAEVLHVTRPTIMNRRHEIGVPTYRRGGADPSTAAKRQAWMAEWVPRIRQMGVEVPDHKPANTR